jgi:5,10-methylene-tetrahydrofolate dehydrogenase/methenyl tetrahydrofolate cyclohydrolase
MFTVPYKNTNLSGQSLKAQLNKWAQVGTIEPDAAESIAKAVAEKPVDLTGQHFVLIGAGSAMGPFTKLLEQGATVVCIDLPSK